MIFTDQAGFEVRMPVFPPKRIISLVPSQTELLYDIGLKESIVGQTIFCVHPEADFKAAFKIGGTKKLNLEKIRSLNPDLIIANKEENLKEDIEVLMKEFPVWISDIVSIDQSLEMILKIGEITNKEAEAKKISDDVKQSLSEIISSKTKQLKTLYLIWKDPYMAAGTHTFIDKIMTLFGLNNCLRDYLEKDCTRYPELNLDEIKKINPEVILLSSEPFPFKQKHIDELKEFLPDSNIILADGEMFSWYGSRMLYLQKYYEELKQTLPTKK
ncbi:MAG: ABC transporter substrate-binding protein [Bacteroidia bacterium]|nr:ABC transporter substrate-binding protein [Bacteroidia bacterium]